MTPSKLFQIGMVAGGVWLCLFIAQRGAQPFRSNLPKDAPQISEEMPIARATLFDSGAVAPGFTLYPELGNASVQLLGPLGKIVHRWPIDATRARLLPSCNLLVLHGSKWGLEQPRWSALSNVLREYSWDGEVEWEYKDRFRLHHDAQKLPSGNYLALRKTEVGAREKRKLLDDPKKRVLKFRSDEVIEIDPLGNVVWQWIAHRHLDLNSCGRARCMLNEKILKGQDEFDWSHVNTVRTLPPNRWFDEGDTRFRPGNLLVMPRNLWKVFLVDRASKEVVWSYGGDFKGGLEGGHEPYMISKGLPGEGNILVFDNGRKRGASLILEIEPPSKRVVWNYFDGYRFFSASAGSMQRLKNGNTLIAEDRSGRVFEVTRDKKIVWEYRGNGMRTARPSRYESNYCPELSRLWSEESSFEDALES